jgi:uncharacterized membrane protein
MTEAIAEAFTVTLLAVMFFVAGVSKLRALDTFEGVVHNFRLLPDALVRPVACVLPVIELAVAAALILPASRFYGACAAAALLALFTVAVAINLVRGRREIDCGSFSSDLKQKLSWWIVARNLALAGLAMWLADFALGAAPSNFIAWTLGGATAVMTIMLYVAGSRLGIIAGEVAVRRAALRAAHQDQHQHQHQHQPQGAV